MRIKWLNDSVGANKKMFELIPLQFAKVISIKPERIAKAYM